MGAAITAIPDTFETITNNPILILAAFVAGLGSLIVGGAISLIPLAGPFINVVFVAPVFVGGLIAMVNAGMDGPSSFGDFTSGVSENYVSLAGAYALMMGAMVALFVVFGIAFVFTVGFGSLGASSAMTGDGGAAGFASGMSVIGLVILFVGFIALLLFSAVLQFVDVSVVVGGESATSSLGRSWSLFTDAPLSVIGYSVLRGLLVSVIIYLPLIVIGGASLAFMDSLGTLLVVGGLYLLLLPLAYVVGIGYHVAYFRQRVERSGGAIA